MGGVTSEGDIDRLLAALRQFLSERQIVPMG
jgi:hypothetical protein